MSEFILSVLPVLVIITFTYLLFFIMMVALDKLDYLLNLFRSKWIPYRVENNLHDTSHVVYYFHINRFKIKKIYRRGRLSPYELMAIQRGIISKLRLKPYQQKLIEDLTNGVSRNPDVPDNLKD